MYEPKLSEVCMEPVIWEALPPEIKQRFETRAVGRINKRCGIVSLMFVDSMDAALLADWISQQGESRLLDIVAIVK